MDSLTGADTTPYELKFAAENLLQRVIGTVTKLIQTDPYQEFIYRRPVFRGGSSADSTSTSMTGGSEESMVNETVWDEVQWIPIEGFELNDAVIQVHEYIALWQLTPATKFTVVPKENTDQIPLMGKRYFVDAIFSKPTPQCPNPLAVAKAHFYINVSAVMPPYYPIMVTYRFEGYRTLFYAVGDKSLRSMSYQRFYIDTILHMKLSFYVEVCKCRHPGNEDDVDDHEDIENFEDIEDMPQI